MSTVDNYIKLPLFGHVFQLNITVMQVGSSTVFIFLKSPLFTLVLLHYLQPQEKFSHLVYQDAYTSQWMPYFLSALIMKVDARQVNSDMAVWESKTFARKIHYKDDEGDEYIRKWREWYSQHYEGCLEKERNR